MPPTCAAAAAPGSGAAESPLSCCALQPPGACPACAPAPAGLTGLKWCLKSSGHFLAHRAFVLSEVHMGRWHPGTPCSSSWHAAKAATIWSPAKVLHSNASRRIRCPAHLNIKALAIADGLPEVLVAAEDGVLGVPHTSRRHRPVAISRDFRISFLISRRAGPAWQTTCDDLPASRSCTHAQVSFRSQHDTRAAATSSKTNNHSRK